MSNSNKKGLKDFSKKPKKQKRPVESDSDSDSDSSQDGIALDKIVSNERTEVVFEFNDMQELYAEGMTILCKKLIINPTTAYEFCLTLSKQDSVGTLIACEEETDAFAFGSILPLPSCSTDSIPNNSASVLINDVLRALSSIKKLSQSTQSMFQKCLASTVDDLDFATGLLVHTRVSNLPTELLAPLHKNVFDDYQWSLKQVTEDVDLKAQTDLFKNMKYLLLLSPCTESSGNELLLSGSAGKKNKKQKTEKVLMNSDRTGSATSNILFDYFEDDMYHNESVASISYASSISNSNNEAKQGMMMASIIPVSAYRKVISEIEKMLG